MRGLYTCALFGIIDIYIYLQILSFAFSPRISIIQDMNQDIFLLHHFHLSHSEIPLFEKFLTLFREYNQHTNLSAIRDEEGILEKHFVDSLYGAEIIQNIHSRHREERSDPENNKKISHSDSIASQTRNDGAIRLLDIGSGWGFPGIPLKIVMPELRVTLLDSVGKKVKAMNHFVSELWLQGIIAIQERAEVLAKDPEHREKYDFVVSRATAYITDILPWSLPFVKESGKIILYKMLSDDEIQDREKIMKKLWLILEWELKYELAGKQRVVLVFSKK